MSEGLKPVGVEMVARGDALFYRALEKGERAVDSFARGVDGASKGANKAFAQMAKGASERIGHLVVDGFVDAGMAVARFVGGSLDAAGKFETGLNRFSSVTGSSMAASGKSIQDFSALFMKMGADTQFSAQQAADAAVELAKGGRSAVQVYKELPDVLTLASAGELDLAKAAEIAANQMAVWENTGVRSVNVSNLLAQAANASTDSVEGFGMGLAAVGNVAKLAGLSFEETVTTLASIRSGFGSASDAGTSLKAFLNNLQPTTKDATRAMTDLGLMTEQGTSKFYDAQGAFIGMEAAAGLLHEATSGLSEAERSLALETIFGSDAMRAAAAIAEQGAPGYVKMGEAMNKAGTAAEQAKEKQKGYAFQMETLRGSLETFQIKLGQLLIGPATEFIVFLTNAVNGLGTFLDMIGVAGDETEETGKKTSTFSTILRLIPFGATGALANDLTTEYNAQTAAAAEASKNTIRWGDTLDRITGVLGDTALRLREAQIATGELGAAGKLTAEEIEKLAKELITINEQGTEAVRAAVDQQASYLMESEVRRTEHLATLSTLNESHRLAETQSERDAIAVKIGEEQAAYQQSQLNADMAYAKQQVALRAHSGEMLITWVNTQVAMGNITAEKGDEINKSIALNFGVAADNTALLFGQMTGTIQQWAIDGKGSADTMSQGLLGMQDQAATAQAKIERLTNQGIKRLDADLKAGIITQAEYNKRLLEIPGEVRTQVNLEAAEAHGDALAVDRALRSIPPVIKTRIEIEERFRRVDQQNAEWARQHGAPAGYATGTRSATRGWAWLGEEGPEAVQRRDRSMAVADYGLYWMEGGEKVWQTDATQSLLRDLASQQIRPPATSSQITQSYSYSTTNAPVYHYAPTYGAAPRNPSHDFALMQARDPVL